MPEDQEKKYIGGIPIEIQDLVYAGRKIEAIKLAREKMGWDLRDAKERVDQVEQKLRTQFPHSFTAKQRIGCGTAGAACVVLAVAGSVLMWRLL